MEIDIKDEIKSIIIKSGWSITDLVAELHEKHGWSNSVPNFSNKLSKGTLRYKEALEIADVIGYNLLWVPKPENVYTEATLESIFGFRGAPRATGRKPGNLSEPSDE